MLGHINPNTQCCHLRHNVTCVVLLFAQSLSMNSACHQCVWCLTAVSALLLDEIWCTCTRAALYSLCKCCISEVFHHLKHWPLLINDNFMESSFFRLSRHPLASIEQQDVSRSLLTPFLSLQHCLESLISMLVSEGSLVDC